MTTDEGRSLSSEQCQEGLTVEQVGGWVRQHDCPTGRKWTVKAEGDDCPVCNHGPEMHDGEGCGYALPDTYTHMTDVQLCGCPMTPPARVRP